MLKLLIQEAAALASLTLFVGMIAIWSQVLGNLGCAFGAQGKILVGRSG